MHLLQICRVLGPANWNNSPGYHTTYFHPIPWHNGKHYNSRPFGQSSLSISGVHTILWTRLPNKFLQKFIPKDLPSLGQAGRVWLQHLVQCVRWPVLDPDDLVGFWNALERTLQVWPLTQIFSVSFLWKIIDLLGGQINDPSSGNNILFRSSQQLPRLRLGPLKGFLSWHSALQGPSTRLVHCFQNYRDTRTPSGVPC